MRVDRAHRRLVFGGERRAGGLGLEHQFVHGLVEERTRAARDGHDARLPQLVGTGTLVAGSPGALTPDNAAPSALACLFIALSAAPTNFKGGKLVPVLTVLTVIVVTSAAGDLPLPWAGWPSGLSGLDLYFQYAIQDAGAIKGTALSNALKADVP